MERIKNKRMIVLLLMVTAGVWGVIGFRLVGWRGDRPAPAGKAVARQVVAGSCEDSLLLNYRDPFLGRKVRRELKKAAGGEATLKPAQVVVEEPDFRFLARVRRGKCDFLVVERGGEQWLMGAGEKINGFSVRQVWGDSVVVGKGGKWYTLYLKGKE